MPLILLRAIVYFQQAIDRDPFYALAYSGLADCYTVLGSFTFRAPHETFPRARAAAQHALAIDKDLAEAHVTLAITAFFGLDRATAERELKLSLAINPNYAVARQWHGMCLVMADFQQGLAELHEAQRLEPLSPMINVQLGVGNYVSRRYDEAVEILEKTLEFEPAFWPAHCFLGMAYAQRNDNTRAIAEMARAIGIRPP